MQEKAQYYRAQAQICIALAGQITDYWAVVALHEMASKYISQAEKLEDVETAARDAQPKAAAQFGA